MFDFKGETHFNCTHNTCSYIDLARTGQKSIEVGGWVGVWLWRGSEILFGALRTKGGVSF